MENRFEIKSLKFKEKLAAISLIVFALVLGTESSSFAMSKKIRTLVRAEIEQRGPGGIYFTTNQIEGSEFEGLLLSYEQRKLSGRFQDTAPIGDETLDLKYFFPPFTKFFTFEGSKNFPDRDCKALETRLKDELEERNLDVYYDQMGYLTVSIDTIYTQISEDLRNDIAQEFGGCLIDAPDEFRFQKLSREWTDREVSEQMRFHIDDLRRITFSVIETLNKESKAETGKPFWNPEHSKAIPVKWHISHAEVEKKAFSSLLLHHNKYDGQTFDGLLKAISSGDEELFLTRLVELATSYPEHFWEGRNSFIYAFTHLYVTKNFPSRGLAKVFMHSIARCGQLYSGSR